MRKGKPNRAIKINTDGDFGLIFYNAEAKCSRNINQVDFDLPAILRVGARKKRAP